MKGKNKSFLLLSCIVLLPITLFAENYKIKKINCNKILVAGKYVRVGDVIDDKDIIVWPSDSAYMVVYSMTKVPQRITVVAGEMRVNRSRSLQEFVNSKRLSSRDWSKPSGQKDTLYMVDTVKCGYYTKKRITGAIEIRARQGEEVFVAPAVFDSNEYQIIIDRSMFKKEGKYDVEVLMKNEEQQSLFFIINKLVLIVLPEWIDD